MPRRRRRTQSLYRRTIALVLVLVGIAICVPAGLTIGGEASLQRSRLRERAIGLTKLAAAAIAGPLAADDMDGVSRLVATLDREDREMNVALVTDRAGKVIVSSIVALEGTAPVGPPTCTAAASAREVTRPDGGVALEVSAPVLVSGESWGALRIEISLSRFESEARWAVARVLLAGAALLVLGALGALWLARSIAGPIVSLSALAGEIADGDLSRRIVVRRNDEIGALGATFNRMADALGAARDGLEQTVRQRTAALRESEERFRQLAENIHSVFWMVNADFSRFLYVSPAYEKVWGRTLASLYETPTSWLSAIHPDDREQVKKTLTVGPTGLPTTPEQSGGGWEKTFRVVRPDGSVRWIRDRSFPIRDERGEVYRVAGIAEDVTGVKHTEAQLRQSQKKMEAVGRLAGGVAHDFNNMLAAITGYADMVLLSLHASDPITADVLQIQKAAGRAAQLTKQLLVFSRKEVIEPKVLDLNAVVRGIHAMLGRLIGEDIDLRLVLDPRLGHVRADPGQIDQVILNLAVNARDAMPRGGRLTIETSRQDLDGGDPRRGLEGTAAGRYVMLAVSDTGCGMSQEVQSHLFEPFFTTKEAGKGTGLGLSTVFGIVQQSGGHVTVYSEVGCGTTCKVYLPLVGDALSTAVAPAAGDLRGKETVLLVEDEALVREIAVRLLRSYGYTVIEAHSGAEALALAGRPGAAFDLLVTDVIMPGMGGRELVERLKLLRPGLRALFISGYTDGAIAENGVLEKGLSLLQKPFSAEGIARKVREVLDAPQGGAT